MIKVLIAVVLCLFLIQDKILSQSIPITIMTYNTSDKGSNWGDRKPHLNRVISHVNPDIMVAIELNNSNDQDFLDNVLNVDSTTYSEAPFIPNDPSIETNSNCLYYKTNKFDEGTVSNSIIQTYDRNGNRYRDINKFTITQNGGETIIIYAAHLSAGHNDVTKEHELDRASEINDFLNYLNQNPPSSTDNYIILGDFNVWYGPSENAYNNLLTATGGYFIDPKNYPSPNISSTNWNNFSSVYTYNSTGPYTRYDMILLCPNIYNNLQDIEYRNDSYFVEGVNSSINTDLTTASDHLPVYAVFLFKDNSGPVELISFTGKYIENNIELSWSTATEINNYGFEIERSIDKKNWERIGFVQGHGNSNIPHDYNFNDNDLNFFDTYYYRLKQIDNDGSYEYSNIVTIRAMSPDQFVLKQNYPNPFNPSTTIEYTLPVDGFVSLKVYDILGKEREILLNSEQKSGFYKIKFNAENLSSGVYFYRLILQPTNNLSPVMKQTKSFVLVK